MRNVAVLSSLLMAATPLASAAAGDAEFPATRCDRLVALGQFDAARAPCEASKRGAGLADLRTALGAERRAVAAEDAVRRAALYAEALDAAERARQKGPLRVTEEAYLQHLARATRRDGGPGAAFWPMAALPVPAPALARVDDPDIVRAQTAHQDSQTRLSELMARADDGEQPESLRVALGRMQHEHTLLERAVLGALEDTITKRPESPPSYWLHLASAYFEVDAHQPDPPARRARGLKVLEQLRAQFPGTQEARQAAVWLAAQRLSGGESAAARTAFEGAGAVDPPYGALVAALLAWQARDDAGVERALPAALGGSEKSRPAIMAVAQALDAERKAEKDPLAAAQRWMEVARLLERPDLADRARLRAAIAWAEAVARGGEPERIPVAARRPAMVYLLGRGRLEPAIAIFDTLVAAAPEADDLPAWGVELHDALRAGGSAPLADRLLGELARRFAAEGPWQKAHPDGGGESVRAAVQERLDARIMPSVGQGVLLSSKEREQLDPLVEARLTHFPISAAERLTLAQSLAKAGFYDRGIVQLKRIRDTEPDEARRLDAARILVQLALARARDAGRGGAAVGPWLEGKTAKPPMPGGIRALLDAQTSLIVRLPPESDERDAAIVERATVRAAFGKGADSAEELRDVVKRHADDELGLRATFQLLASLPVGQREQVALLHARHRTGPPEREAALHKTFTQAYRGKPGDPVAAIMAQRLYNRAAAAYAEYAAAATDSDDRERAHIAAAVAWTLALRAPEAIAAWVEILALAPNHPLAPQCRWHLAELLLATGDRPAAADVLEAIATRGDPRGDEAAARLIDLYALDAGRLRAALELLVDRYPEHPRAAEARQRLEQMRAAAPEAEPPPPASDPACPGCGPDGMFWPVGDGG